MPQPFKLSGRIHVGPGSLNNFPKIAARIGMIAAHEEQIQLYMTLVLAAMLGHGRSAGLTMFNALSGSTQRRSVIDAIAVDVLDPQDHKAFEAITKKMTTSRKNRNSVVHGIWAVTDGHFDKLLRIDPSDQISHYVKTGVHPMRDGIRDGLKFWHWAEKDFIDVEKLCSEISDELIAFMLKIDNKYQQTPDAALRQAASQVLHPKKHR